MTPGDMARVLAKAAAFDQRTVGEADVLAWYEVAGHITFDDGMAAVSRHYAGSRDRLWPVDLLREAKEISKERLEREQHAEIAARAHLPNRKPEITAALRELADKLAVPPDDEISPAQRAAMLRARQERRGKPPTALPRQRRTGQPIDLDRITTPPSWATREGRDRVATSVLHHAGRDCGRPACTNCAPTRKDT